MNHSSRAPGGAAADPDARLRAADPAADAEPDMTALRAAVRDRAEAAPPDQLAAARSRRWGWPARATAAAAAALLVGAGGGYAVGASGDGPSVPPAAAPMTLGQPEAGASGGGVAGVGPAAPEAGALALPEPGRAVEGGADAAWSMPWGGGRTVFTSSGLSTDGGSARVWAFDPAASFTEQTAAAAAAALGVEGSPVLTHGTWTVGPTDGTGANVQLYPDGTASLSYYDPTKDPWACPVAERPVDDAGADIMPEPEPCTQRDLGPAPSADAATAQLRDLISALGLDAGSFEYEAQQVEDQLWAYVSAHHVVDGQRTGVQWNASFTGAGVQSLHGSTAPVLAMGDYAVVSPEEAVERLMDPRFGTGGGPIAYVEGAEPRPAEMPVPDAEGPRLPPTMDPGSPVSWPVEQVTITGSRLGVALHTQADGAAVLLPTYELISDDGRIWSVVAVAEQHLDLTGGR